MAGRSPVLVLAVALVTGVFAGCLSETPETDPDYSISRQLRVLVDDDNWREFDDGSPEVYDFVESTFVVTVRKAEIAPGALRLGYRDRTGADVDRPLSDFTTKTALLPGDTVRIEDADIASHAVLTHDGTVVASRVLRNATWWNALGAPMGFALDPGAVLSYKVTGGFDETATLSDVRIKEPAIHIDALTAAIHVKQETDGRLDFTGAEEVVTATTTHKARPLAWTFEGSVTVPMTFEFTGTDVESGEPVAAGIEVLPASGVAFDVAGKLWVDADGRVVSGEVAGGSFSTDADAIAWATGLPGAEDFSCNGKTRADACRPTEWDFEEFRNEEDIPPQTESFDRTEDEIPSEILANLTRFLAEDLQPGDELLFDVHLTEAAGHDVFPDGTVLDWTARIKAVGFEQVTVGAGTFEALKVIEQVRVDSRVPALGDTPVAIEQTLLEATFWFEPVTFVPLRLEYVVPFNIGQVAAALIDDAGDEFWADAPVERFDAKDLNVVTETRFAMELVEKKGGARFSPWMTLAGAQYAGGAPGIALAATAYVWVSGFGTSAEIRTFPQIVLKDAAPEVGPTSTAALAELQHRGGDPISWYDYELNVFHNDDPVSAMLANEESCEDATPYPYDRFAVGDRIYLCPGGAADWMMEDATPDLAPWRSGDELKLQIVDVNQNTIVYENTIIVA